MTSMLWVLHHVISKCSALLVEGAVHWLPHEDKFEIPSSYQEMKLDNLKMKRRAIASKEFVSYQTDIWKAIAFWEKNTLKNCKTSLKSPAFSDLKKKRPPRSGAKNSSPSLAADSFYLRMEYIQYIKVRWHRLRVFEAVSHTNKGSDRKMSIITLGKIQ